MKQTENFNLNKPDREDYVQIEDLNQNMDILDEFLGKFKDGVNFKQDEKDGLKELLRTYRAESISDANMSNPPFVGYGQDVVNAPSPHFGCMVSFNRYGSRYHQLWFERTTPEGLYFRLRNGGSWEKVIINSDLETLKEEIQEHIKPYIHPSTHPASMITTDTNRRFMTDNEKEKWNEIKDLGKPVIIPASSNLNNYRNSGYYFCSTSSTVSSVYNLPTEVSDPFYLTVLETGSSSVTQVLICGNREYIRSATVLGDSYSWSNWMTVLRKGDLTKSDVGLSKVINEKQATSKDLENHINARLPHIGTRSNGTRYRWGFRSKDGSLIYMEEDV